MPSHKAKAMPLAGEAVYGQRLWRTTGVRHPLPRIEVKHPPCEQPAPTGPEKNVVVRTEQSQKNSSTRPKTYKTEMLRLDLLSRAFDNNQAERYIRMAKAHSKKIRHVPFASRPPRVLYVFEVICLPSKKVTTCSLSWLCVFRAVLWNWWGLISYKYVTTRPLLSPILQPAPFEQQ